jgi:hypothetical protein
MSRPRKSERLARELALDATIELNEDHENPYVLRRLCDLAEEKMTAGDTDCLRIARLCCRIASRLGSDEARALGFGRLASALRLVDRLDHSEIALKIAFDVAPDHLVGYLVRFRCYLRIYQGRLGDALKDARAAVELSTGADHARALSALGIVLGYQGDTQGAIHAHEQCLVETDPDAKNAYCNAIHNYATSLSRGTDKQARKALDLCAEARSKLRRRHKMQRAKLHWTEGLLLLRLGDHQNAWLALNVARRSLIALRAAPEVAAVVADMARVDPEPLAVRQVCYEAADVIVAPHALSAPLRALASAEREVIPEAAARLRRAAGASTACPVL